MTSGVFDPALSVAATGLVGDFHAAGALAWGDVHAARHLCHLYGEQAETVALAVALTVRALRVGSVCLDLARVREAVASEDEAVSVPDELWPAPVPWREALSASPLIAQGAEGDARALRLVGDRLYLERYWQEEEQVRRALLARWRTALPGPDPARLAATLAAAFPTQAEASQRAAARSCLTSALTVIAGGPGTGKTTTIARILDLLLAEDPHRRIALAAPTGKAAARMDEALRAARADLPAASSARLAQVSARTIHKLLGWTPENRNRFVHDGENPLPHDVAVVDETSMVSLTLMARLLEAVGPQTRLILVGDPDQLASVEAGAVLSDITRAGWRAAEHEDRPAPVAVLRHNFRFDGRIGDLAAAIRDGDADAALTLLRAGDEVGLTEPGTSLVRLREAIVAAGRGVDAAARTGDLAGALAALDSHRLLCAHRQGPFGVQRWGRIAEAWLREAIEGFGADGEWYTGRPLLMTTNLNDLGLYNGDTGVVIRGADHRPRVYFSSGSGVRSFSPYLLEGAQTVFAMTVHKAQGSQFEAVSVVLPPEDSPLLTRELLYTAVTRASRRVDLIGPEASVRRAIAQRARRASGLRDRL